MSIQVIRQDGWEEKEGWRETIEDYINTHNNDVFEVWNKLIRTGSDTFIPTRLPRDLNTDYPITREGLQEVIQMYRDFIMEVSAVVEDVDDFHCQVCVSEDSNLNRYIENHFTSKDFRKCINPHDIESVYELQNHYKEAYKSHKALIKWVDTHDAYIYNRVKCMFVSKQAIMYYDLIRAEIHKRLSFQIVREKEVVKTINKVPHFIKELLINNMKEQNKTHDCPICMDTIQAKDIKFSGCGHMYCEECLSRIGRCAVCRESL